jgi:hypothetical protein
MRVRRLSALGAGKLVGSGVVAFLLGTGLQACSSSLPPLFAAVPEKPVTKKATGITATSAVLHGELDTGAGSEKVGWSFIYRPGASCGGGAFAPEVPGEAEGNHKEVSETVTELQPSTLYSYCLNAINGEGETLGSGESFTTAGKAPVIESESTAGMPVTPLDAVLEGRVNPENQATSYHFEYASSPALTAATVIGEGSLPGIFEGQTAGPVDLGGVLEPSTVYYYRLVATNGTGTSDGAIETFTTEPLQAPLIE